MEKRTGVQLLVLFIATTCLFLLAISLSTSKIINVCHTEYGDTDPEHTHKGGGCHPIYIEGFSKPNITEQLMSLVRHTAWRNLALTLLIVAVVLEVSLFVIFFVKALSASKLAQLVPMVLIAVNLLSVLILIGVFAADRSVVAKHWSVKYYYVNYEFGFFAYLFVFILHLALLALHVLVMLYFSPIFNRPLLRAANSIRGRSSRKRSSCKDISEIRRSQLV